MKGDLAVNKDTTDIPASLHDTVALFAQDTADRGTIGALIVSDQCT